LREPADRAGELDVVGAVWDVVDPSRPAAVVVPRVADPEAGAVHSRDGLPERARADGSLDPAHGLALAGEEVADEAPRVVGRCDRVAVEAHDVTASGRRERGVQSARRAAA